MVLTKGFDERGLVFFTNYASRKAGELEANPQAALLFHWPELGRQVRIEGRVGRVERAETEAYARSRSRASQLSALASPQSRPVPGREWLEQRVAELDREHAGGELPVREDWGGYRLAPAAWEFWQHRPNRLHDRFRYLPEARRLADRAPRALAVREGLDRDAVVALAHAQLVGRPAARPPARAAARRRARRAGVMSAIEQLTVLCSGPSGSA